MTASLPEPEAGFQHAVIEHAHLRGWLVAHFHAVRLPNGRVVTPATADGAGWPDLVLVHTRRGLMLFRELKTDRGTLTRPQRMWGDRICAAGGDWDVWRPRDWDRIEHQLRGRP